MKSTAKNSEKAKKRGPSSGAPRQETEDMKTLKKLLRIGVEALLIIATALTVWLFISYVDVACHNVSDCVYSSWNIFTLR